MMTPFPVKVVFGATVDLSTGDENEILMVVFLFTLYIIIPLYAESFTVEFTTMKGPDEVGPELLFFLQEEKIKAVNTNMKIDFTGSKLFMKINYLNKILLYLKRLSNCRQPF